MPEKSNFYNLQERKNRLFNKSEETVYQQLIKSESISQSNVFSKIRIADVINITNSGISKNWYSYALKAHFDFVICDDSFMPKFVIEFNGPSHLDEKKKMQDDIKAGLCKRFDLPLLQINDRYLKPNYGEKLSLLAWILDIYYIQKEFDIAQEKGDISWEEDLHPLFIYISDLNGNSSCRYAIGDNSRLKLQNLYEQNKLLDSTPSGIIGYDKNGVFRGCSFISVDNNFCIYTDSAMRNYNFPAKLNFLFEEILIINLEKKIDNYLLNNKGLMPLENALERALKLRKKIHLISCGSCGEITNYFNEYNFFSW